MKLFHSRDYWKNYKTNISAKQRQVDAYAMVADRIRRETEQLRDAIPILRTSLEPIRKSAQEAENKLSITIGQEIVPLPPEIEAQLREGLAAATQRPNPFVRTLRKIRHTAYSVAATVGRLFDTTSDVWPQRWQQVVARIVPPIAAVSTGVLTAVGVIAAAPIVIGAIAASTALTAHHIGNNADRDNLKVYRGEIDLDFAPAPVVIRGGLAELSRTLMRTMLRPIHTIAAYKQAGLNPFDLYAATSVEHALKRKERASKRDLRLLTDEHQELSERSNTMRLSIEAFRAWKRLAQWEREDEVDRRIDRTRDLKAEFAASRVLNQPIPDPVASIDLKELAEIAGEKEPALEAGQRPAVPASIELSPKIAIDKRWIRSGPATVQQPSVDAGPGGGIEL